MWINIIHITAVHDKENNIFGYLCSGLLLNYFLIFIEYFVRYTQYESLIQKSIPDWSIGTSLGYHLYQAIRVNDDGPVFHYL